MGSDAKEKKVDVTFSNTYMTREREISVCQRQSYSASMGG